MTAPKTIASILLLFSCAKVQDVATKTADVAEQCAYLNNYAKEAQEFVTVKNYNAALAVANAAYMKSLETKGAPCVDAAKDLAKSVYAAVAAGSKTELN